MKRSIWSLVTVVVLALVLTACGQVGASPTLAAGEAAPALGGGGGGVTYVSSNGQYVEGLVAIGTGTASAEPEVAQITFGIELRGDDPAALVDQGAGKIERAIAAVQKLGVSEEDVRTSGYNLWVETVYDPEKGLPTGEVIYHLSHHVRATLRDLDKVGEVLAAAVEAGANSISEVSFSVEQPDALMEQARQQALENAAARAQQMAEGLDISLGKPVTVMETGGGFPVPVERGIGGGGGGMVEMAAPSISPGTFSVSVSVQIVYEIQ